MTDVSTSVPVWWWAIGAAAALLLLFVLVVWMKGRAFAEGAVFRASRLSARNHLLPTQVLITPSAVVQYTPAWIGKQEESIHMAHIASVKIQTGVLLSNIVVETSGGANSIRCHGHRKADAIEMKRLIDAYQDAYFRGVDRPAASPAAPDPTGR